MIKPFRQYQLPHGSSSQREAAYLQTQYNNNKQMNLIKGGKNPTQVSVPSFGNSYSGPDNPTANSIFGNSVALKAKINSVGDCHATGTCKTLDGGGKKKYSVNRKMHGGHSRYDYKNWHSEFGTPLSGGKKRIKKTKKNRRRRKKTMQNRKISNKTKQRKLRKRQSKK